MGEEEARRPGGGRRPLTDEERAVQVVQGMLLNQDFRHGVMRRNLAAPFASLQDAAAQLIPFHVRGRPRVLSCLAARLFAAKARRQPSSDLWLSTLKHCLRMHPSI